MTFTLSNGKEVEFPTEGRTVVGCDGKESPFSYKGRHYLYVWNKDIAMHLYYCFEDDVYYFDYSHNKNNINMNAILPKE